ncbi:NAD-dependent malic enzyme [Desulfurivibrio alkaliphilus]|uniref:Malate dehydrogenase (Oxaloacetate-decarboxylating) (NADP(+)) n=1 Tax=Desulfurivibrio alkaliphilus (strain DSM 19089 / UNIQEM U267 / AHT2) TaxID=589865 RepID=D6Z0G9_DESAT|nr:NAD-dependent malic enzyme [Desulfurivibrio alkaliphilus]ADH85198.1 Malate dehydrogenase (oxaloacetate-decarboxylating) (NADP(+)) [Desulfurivibrio alkaliphilus AHT 2]
MPFHSSYRLHYNEFGNTREIEILARGIDVYDNSFINKGTAFTQEERELFALHGTLPPSIRSLANQMANSRQTCAQKSSDLEKFIYLRSLFDRNVALAHALIASDLERYLPIIYTPTVGEACRHYSSMFRKANGLFFYPGNIDRAEEILRRFVPRQIRVAVVTDNQGILGIGDQGVGGIAICLGKLMLYTQGAGIAPWHCLPISLDVGTDNPELLNDDNYLGWRHPRLRDDDYVAFVQRFALAFKAVFPHALCQWEDFSKQNAFAIRDAYLHRLISFNDDIQGTGAVALAAILAALRSKGEKLGDQVFLVHGAGAGGIGIAEQLAVALQEEGLDETAARARIFTVDRRGLVTTDRSLEPYKKKFAHDPATLPWLRETGAGSLAELVRKAGVTVLIGTSGQADAFGRELVQAMLANTARPVILPLSNPTGQSEARPAELAQWSQGRALVATGSPFPPLLSQGRMVRVGQCNNVFIFPGVGLGVLASGAAEVRPEFFTAAARAVADRVAPADLAAGVLLPEVGELREVSRAVAVAVGESAIKAGVAGPCAVSTYQHHNDPTRLARLIDGMRWRPGYLPLVNGYAEQL